MRYKSSMRLLIVESPNKVAKLQGFADDLYGQGAIRVAATVGHWRGLPPMAGQGFNDVVDVSAWKEHFVVHRHDVAAKLGPLIRSASEVLLASDPDREGEAIAWHVLQEFQPRTVRRVTFTSITKPALKQAIDNAGVVDLQMVDAQRARQVLDYCLGMEVSRRLWRFGCKSAGRVQSAALRIVVDRENAIQAFKAEDYWTVHATYGEGFEAAVAVFEAPSDEELDDTGETKEEALRLRPKRFTSKAEAEALIADGRKRRHVVEAKDVKPIVRRPKPPFTTSTLQAEASTALGWDPDRTAKVAQTLFEGGLVTYIRTDSVSLSDEAVADIRACLRDKHPHVLPSNPQVYSDRAGAQGAHEAIRPTHMVNADATRLIGDERALYDLIWRRTLLSQAASAEIDATTVTICPEGAAWRLLTRGSVVRRPGFLELVGEAVEAPPDETGRAEEGSAKLPSLSVGQPLSLVKLEQKGGKTKAPPRFTAASLIRYLERKGIGRPSTYASIISTLLDRDYLKKAKNHLVPDESGFLCDRLTRVSFDALTQERFTAVTEAALDKIATGNLQRAAFLTSFYAQFTSMLTLAEAHLADYAKRHPELDREAAIPHDAPCAKCGASMLRRRGKFGTYAQCTAENCGVRVNLEALKEAKDPCPICGAVVVEQPYMKDGKRSTYFRCKNGDWKNSSKPPKRTKVACYVDSSHGKLVQVSDTRTDSKKRFVCLACDYTTLVLAKPPPCPLCRAPTSNTVNRNGEPFWGCSQYRATGCRGALPYAAPAPAARKRSAT